MKLRIVSSGLGVALARAVTDHVVCIFCKNTTAETDIYIGGDILNLHG